MKRWDDIGLSRALEARRRWGKGGVNRHLAVYVDMGVAGGVSSAAAAEDTTGRSANEPGGDDGLRCHGVRPKNLLARRPVPTSFRNQAPVLLKPRDKRGSSAMSASGPRLLGRSLDSTSFLALTYHGCDEAQAEPLTKVVPVDPDRDASNGTIVVEATSPGPALTEDLSSSPLPSSSSVPGRAMGDQGAGAVDFSPI